MSVLHRWCPSRTLLLGLKRAKPQGPTVRITRRSSQRLPRRRRLSWESGGKTSFLGLRFVVMENRWKNEKWKKPVVIFAFKLFPQAVLSWFFAAIWQERFGFFGRPSFPRMRQSSRLETSIESWFRQKNKWNCIKKTSAYYTNATNGGALDGATIRKLFDNVLLSGQSRRKRMPWRRPGRQQQ